MSLVSRDPGGWHVSIAISSTAACHNCSLKIPCNIQDTKGVLRGCLGTVVKPETWQLLGISPEDAPALCLTKQMLDFLGKIFSQRFLFNISSLTSFCF